MFTGEYRHTVDDKGRIAVPVKFRAQLDPGSMISGWLDDCLAIHTKTGWEELSSKIAALPFTDEKARLFARFVFSRAVEVEMDKQGRVLLPAYLRESVGLVNEVVMVGSRDHAEIWAPDRWDVYRQALDDPRELASAFSGLGI
ncbi:MAG: division/cell wall cluster transcriptional repressor MraZ [Chloroflexota bacterium]